MISPRYSQCRDLLLREQLSDEEVCSLLTPIGFTDWRAADRCLQRIANDPYIRLALADCLPDLFMALANAANPDHTVVSFERFTQSVTNRLGLLRYLVNDPRAIDILITLFAGSQFLTEILLRNPEYFALLTERKQLVQLKSTEQFYAEAHAAVVPFTMVDNQLNALRRFQRRELLRIGASDLLGLWDLPTVTAQLSRLADSLVRVCLQVAAMQANTAPEGFAVIAMGKLGGRELNYSSDIDLLFLAASDDATAYQRLGQCLIEALTRMTAEGFLYRVDMRLRPWGSSGPLVSSLTGYHIYLQKHARLWEKQALLKARVIAGDEAVGNTLLEQIEPLLFAVTDEAVRADVRTMKQRIEAHLHQQGKEWGEVKSGEGSIRDVEFVTQYLQLVHGAKHPEIRSRNTLDALARLSASALLAADEYLVLTDGYTFLRTIEHYLQMMHYQQTHLLPSSPEECIHLARRLGFQGPEAGTQLLGRYQQHKAAIRAIYQRYLGTVEEQHSTIAAGATASSPQFPPPDIQQHLTRMDPSYAATFSEEEIKQHAALAKQLDEHTLVKVDAISLDDENWRVTIVAYDYLGALSVICGLLFVYGFNILDGEIFTYEPLADAVSSSSLSPTRRSQGRRAAPKTAREDSRRKIVDVFTVRTVLGAMSTDRWTQYTADLTSLLRRLQARQHREAQGELAKRVAVTLQTMTSEAATLYPVDIEIDNGASGRYTVLRIDALDTIGFLYTLTNALALSGIYIGRVTVHSVGNRVHDTLYVTDTHGQKITTPHKQRELRVATVLVKHFTHLLPSSPNPESALLHFHDFLSQLFTRPNWPDEIASLRRPEVLDALARLLGISDFLWDDFLRLQYTNLFPVVRDLDALTTAKSAEQLRAELDAASQNASDTTEQRAVLNAFKDREMFRIDMRHIQGHITDFGQFSAELTDLVEVVVAVAYRLCLAALHRQFGVPCGEDGTPAALSICALGKAGGRELGFASDIELMFIFAENGKTTGPQVITTVEFYAKLIEEFVHTIQARREGIFEIDLRLRPYGKAGSMAVSLEAFRRYFASGGAAWAYERQALVKLRPIAGDAEFGTRVVALRDELIYTGEPFETAAMRAMRERQVRQLVTAGTFNAKYSPGGLVDVEYIVQGLQIAHGHSNPRLRLTNTSEAMAALAAAGILSTEDYTRLCEAHTFFRRLIDALRVVRGNAKELTVPAAESEELAFLARRLGYGSELTRLRSDLTRYSSSVQELSIRLLG
jgi:glutamate-ammonia-ligase adenylyltransferase